MSNVTYLDVGKDEVHELLAAMAEDAEIDGVIVIMKKGPALSIAGGNISVGEMAVSALLLDETAKDMVLGNGE